MTKDDLINWMKEHPTSVFIYIALILLFVGAWLGAGVTAWVYNSEVERLLVTSSELGVPMEFNHSYYNVQITTKPLPSDDHIIDIRDSGAWTEDKK